MANLFTRRDNACICTHMTTRPSAITNDAPSPCTCFRARKLARLLTQRYDRELAGTGITVNQFSILRHAQRKRHSITSLAQALGMDRSTLSRELSPLREAGWLELVTGSDARQRQIRITDSGRRQIRSSQAAWRSSQQSLVDDLGEPALARLHQQLDAAIDSLSAAST